MIVIPTIPHTGTHFIAWEVLGPGQVENKDYILRHIQPDNMYWVEQEVARCASSIATFRHPLATAQSWKNRGKPIYELTNMYDCLAWLLKRNDIRVIPIDSPARDEYYDGNWPVRRYEGHYDFKLLTAFDRQVVDLIVENHQGLLRQYGYEHDTEHFENSCAA